MEGIGSISIWGYSPALDLINTKYSECEQDINTLEINEENCENEMSFLVIAPSDPRHIIKTMARSWRHGYKSLNFYLMETQTSILARDIILLSIIMDWKEDIGVQERIELFLEIFGNICVREKTEAFIKERAYELIRTITDSESISSLSKIIDVSNLRFRERDDLEFVFKFWRSPNKSYEILKYWDYRLRAYYKRRFDFIENVSDWDYQMKLKPKADIINQRLYTKWRKTGQAFEVRESLYDRPNRVSATVEGMKEDGLTVSKWGYFSDIVIGPFIAFGCDLENKKYLKKANDMYTKTSQDVSEYNIRSYIYELKNKKLYIEKEENNEEEEKITEINENNDQENENENKIKFPDILNNSNLYLLPCDPTYTFVRKISKFKQKFDRIYISNSMVHRLKEYSLLLKPNGEMIIETAKFMIELNEDLMAEYNKKIISMANEANLILKSGIIIPEVKQEKYSLNKKKIVYERSNLVFIFK